MSSSCKLGERETAGKMRLQEEDDTSTANDRLSHLPEPILHHILSFLDTKSAVQTSVLSHAWRCTWRHVPVLDFVSLSFEEYGSFVSFVDKVLSLRYPLNLCKVSFIDKVVLNDEEHNKHWRFPRVVEYALAHNAQHLVVVMERPWWIQESCLFSSGLNCNLKTLELTYAFLDRVGFGSSVFQSMTTLHLHVCFLHSEEDLVCVPNFPCLENLVLSACRGPILRPDHQSIKISGVRLLSLKLTGCFFTKIDVSAPCLKFFTLDDAMVPLGFSELSLPSLDYADIRMNRTADLYLIALFFGLHNAKSLTLDSKTIQEVSKFNNLEHLPSPFTRLKYLNVQSSTIPYKVATYFLKGSPDTEPNIEFLPNGTQEDP
ncbi:unnamed protein product [Linum trigynum]|uniref:F-box domain-containing protein n=1 Tax=Linum trigynum TaxID=586398 RepID=A0AAV2DQF3_9ROSI